MRKTIWDSPGGVHRNGLHRKISAKVVAMERLGDTSPNWVPPLRKLGMASTPMPS